MMDLSQYNQETIITFLQSYEGLTQDVVWLSDEWATMTATERHLQQAALMPCWEKRTMLGQLYQAKRLSPAQIEQLQNLDQQLLEHAIAVELVCQLPLAELVRYLLKIGTPLTQQPAPVRIETTMTALAELVNQPQWVAVGA